MPYELIWRWYIKELSDKKIPQIVAKSCFNSKPMDGIFWDGWNLLFFFFLFYITCHCNGLVVNSDKLYIECEAHLVGLLIIPIVYRKINLVVPNFKQHCPQALPQNLVIWFLTPFLVETAPPRDQCYTMQGDINAVHLPIVCSPFLLPFMHPYYPSSKKKKRTRKKKKLSHMLPCVWNVFFSFSHPHCPTWLFGKATWTAVYVWNQAD